MIKRVRDLNQICANGLCIGCGICESLAGKDHVEMTMVEPGYLRPKTKQSIPSDLMERILDICPGVSMDGSCVEKTPLHDAVMGPGVSAWRGRAAQDVVQFRAAAGGALTALGMYLVDSDEVNFILHVVASEQAPMLTERKLSFDAGAVLDGAASRYGPGAPLVDVTHLLDRGEPFAFIGKPCDVAALKNLARHDRRAADLVKYTLTLSCAGVPALGFSKQFLERHHMREDDLSEFRYRGHGWPGATFAKTTDGREAQESYLKMWYPYNQKWKTQFRCKICPDATGELADITSVDDWPTGFPETEERIGRSLVVARTNAGDKLVRRAIEAGYLKMLPAPEKMLGLHQTQPHQVTKKRGIFSRLFAMWLSGLPVPRFRNMRLLASAATTHPLFHLRNLIGLRRRVRSHQHRERVPR